MIVVKSYDHAACGFPTLLSTDHGSSTVCRYGQIVGEPKPTGIISFHQLMKNKSE